MTEHQFYPIPQIFLAGVITYNLVISFTYLKHDPLKSSCLLAEQLGFFLLLAIGGFW